MPKITLDRISYDFRLIGNFLGIFFKMAGSDHFLKTDSYQNR